MLCGLSASAEAMLGLRFLQGIGGAMIYATGVALISSAFPPQERGRALGLYTSSVYVGLTTGPLIGGALTGLLSWRYVFFFNVPLGCLVIALTISRLKGEWVEAKGERLDLVGSAVYGLATALLVVGLSLKSLVGVVLGTALLAAFAFWELREKWPVLEVKLFKNVTFAFSNLAALINYAATYAVSYALSLYLQHVKGMPPHYAGFVLTAQPAVQALVSPLAGYTADRVEPRVVASIGMALTAVGLWSLSGIGLGTSVESIIMGLMFVGGRPRPLRIAEHEGHNELRLEQVLRRGIGHDRDDEEHGPSNEHGDNHALNDLIPRRGRADGALDLPGIRRLLKDDIPNILSDMRCRGRGVAR
jgi:MFS family permease